MRKTNYLQIVTFDLQRAAGPYRWANFGNVPEPSDCRDGKETLLESNPSRALKMVG